jgi:acetyltransferase-like isoleucine patch superfamily enzyme
MRLIILGAGGYGRTVADVAKQAGEYSRIDFLDDDATKNGILGCCADWRCYCGSDVFFYPAFGNNQTRLLWIRRFINNNCNVPVLIHKTAYISATAKIGKGVVVLPNVTINTDVVIEDGCLINCGAIIDHGCHIKEGCHIGLGAIIKGQNCINAFTVVEAGQIIQRGNYGVRGEQE